jgi:hypothetical protein
MVVEVSKAGRHLLLLRCRSAQAVGTAVGESPQARTSGLVGTSLPLLLISQKVVIAEVMIMLMMKTMALMVMMAVIPAWLRRPVGCRCGPPVVNPWRTPASASFVP